MPRKYKEPDKKDRKILCLLNRDARIPLTRLSKLISVSREVVNYRIQKLVKLGYIKSFNLVVSNRQLDFDLYYIPIKLQNITNEILHSICGFLMHHPNVKYLGHVSGNWDINMAAVFKDKADLTTFIDKINELYGDYISENPIFLSISVLKYETLDFIEKMNYEQQKVEQVGKKIEMDQKDREILKCLSVNSRLHISELARRTKINSESCARKFNRLRKIGVIKNYKAIVDLERFGLQQYILLLKINKLSTEKIKKITNFLRAEKNVLFAERIVGNFDLKIEIVAENQKQFHEQLTALRSYLREDIKQYSFSIVMRSLKDVSYPEGMWE